MEAAVYDRPLASLPMRKPRPPMEYPTPDLDRFNRSGPSLTLLRNRHAMTRQFYSPQSRSGGTGCADLRGAMPGSHQRPGLSQRQAFPASAETARRASAAPWPPFTSAGIVASPGDDLRNGLVRELRRN